MKKYLITFLSIIFFFPIVLLANKPVLSIGGKYFTEQYLLVELSKQLLEAHGYEVKTKTGVSTLILRDALKNGQIDMYYEYTGTGYTLFYKQKNRTIMTDKQKTYEWVRDHDSKIKLVWEKPLDFNNTYAIALTPQAVKKYPVNTISDLANLVKTKPDALRFALDAESYQRVDGFKGIMKEYGFILPMNRIIKMDSGLVYLALKENFVDGGIVFTTDGRIKAFNLHILEDNKHFYPVYNPALVIRQSVLDTHPDIPNILGVLNHRLTTATMQNLNYQVDILHRSAKTVAHEWLLKNKLLKL